MANFSETYVLQNQRRTPLSDSETMLCGGSQVEITKVSLSVSGFYTNVLHQFERRPGWKWQAHVWGIIFSLGHVLTCLAWLQQHIGGLQMSRFHFRGYRRTTNVEGTWGAMYLLMCRSQFLTCFTSNCTSSDVPCWLHIGCRVLPSGTFTVYGGDLTIIPEILEEVGSGCGK